MTTEQRAVPPTLNPAAIVPRWEWRTFGTSFAGVEDRLAALPLERVQESTEMYFLSRDGDASVKFRDGVLDVKLLEDVDANGLECWRPVLKASFPLTADDARVLLSALRVDAPTVPEETTLEALLEEIVRPNDALRAVTVHKRRARYSPKGCTAELTDIRTDVGATRTIAVEHEDPTLVAAAVRELGADLRPNICVARGLKQLVGLVSEERFAVIDVGSNSVKLCVADRRPRGEWRTVLERSEVTRLAEGLSAGRRLQPEPIRRTADAICALAVDAHRVGAGSVTAVGTAALRIAANPDALIDPVRERCGVEVEVIRGTEEARLGYLAATGARDHGTGALVVFETGGGSSQFTFGHGGVIDEQFSIKVGAVGLTERYRLDQVVSERMLAEALHGIAADLDELDGRPTPPGLIAIGGAATNLAAVKLGLARYDAQVVEGTVLDRAEVDRQIELYAERSADERRSIVGLQPDRAPVILAGACVVRTVLEKLGRDSLEVSDRGLRHGVLAVRYGEARRHRSQNGVPRSSH